MMGTRPTFTVRGGEQSSVGRRFAGTRVRMLINDRHIRVLNLAGQLLGDYTIDPTRNYQARNKP